MTPRTIDNLGLEPSKQYAANQLDEFAILQDPFDSVSSKISIDTLSPQQTELENLFGTDQKNVPLAAFTLPEGYALQRNRLFTHQLIPSLGSEEWQQEQLERILKRRKQQNKKKQGQEDWVDEQKAAHSSDTLNAVKDLFRVIASFDRDLAEIHAKRSQYQKG